jgi:hypothetical protein
MDSFYYIRTPDNFRSSVFPALVGYKCFILAFTSGKVQLPEVHLNTVTKLQLCFLECSENDAEKKAPS